MKLKQKTGRTKKTQAFDVVMLKQPEVETAFDIEVHNRFAILESVDGVEDTWSQFKTTIVAVAEKVVGRKRGSRKERSMIKQIKKQLCQGQLMTKIHDELKCEYKVKDK